MSSPKPSRKPGSSSRPLLNFLIAYPYCSAAAQQRLADNSSKVRVLLDSGAFTAWKAGKPIALDDYCSFLDKLKFKPWRYFALDVVGNPKATLENYNVMLKRGFKPVPVFTRGSDPALLEEYYKTTDLVGIGGLVGTNDSEGYVNGAMNLIGKRHAHWLGFMRLNYIKAWRPYSCDATNFNRGSRYGWVDIYLGHGRMPHLNRPTAQQGMITQEVVEAARRYGFDAWQLGSPKGWKGKKSVAVLLPYYSWVHFSLDAEAMLGTKVFLAGSSADLPIMLDAYERICT